MQLKDAHDVSCGLNMCSELMASATVRGGDCADQWDFHGNVGATAVIFNTGLASQLYKTRSRQQM